MSGEQAEERTAREGRAKEYLSKLLLDDPNEPNEDTFIITFPRASEIVEGREFWQTHLSELLAAYAQSECSRLASRVEELERVLGDVLAMAVTEHDSTYVGGKNCEGCQAVARAERVLTV